MMINGVEDMDWKRKVADDLAAESLHSAMLTLMSSLEDLDAGFILSLVGVANDLKKANIKPAYHDLLSTIISYLNQKELQEEK